MTAEFGATSTTDDVLAGVDLSGRKLDLADGATLPFDRLVLATGSLPRLLPLPGADLAGEDA